MGVIDMRAMRYINLLDKIAKVKTRKCFVHNNILFFAVNGKSVSRAIGPAASNIKNIQEKIGKKVRIIREDEGLDDVKRFIEDIVSPVRLKSVEVKEGCIVITAGNNQNKASLIGRNKRRYLELKKILQDFYHLDLKII
ncbi:MAG: KH domain-containing protein [Nanoarchaeota archaeon]|nr:KH domain-containing protein [Nanoarchaeota archaeon]MBU1051400.1 KH domain-containing protein [Nanoarchaeota archaeon]MBU1987896.1 KH domain-containing protein [Nanoarchaeota archaeon]